MDEHEQLNPPITSSPTLSGNAGASASRRQFLRQAAAGVGSAALGGTALWLTREPDPTPPLFYFALVSDTHVGKFANASAEQMQRAVQEVNSSGADFTVFCGDLIDHGELSENQPRYNQWRRIAEGLTNDYYAIPGNHDPDEPFRTYLGRETDFVIDHKGHRLICFKDALLKPWHDGLVKPEQVRWISQRAREAADAGQRAVLISHVTYHENHRPDAGKYIREGREALTEVLASRQNISAFFAGHFHCGLRGWNDNFGIQEVILPSTSHNANRSFRRMGGYHFNEFRTGWTLVSVHADEMILRYKPLGAPLSVRKRLSLRPIA